MAISCACSTTFPGNCGRSKRRPSVCYFYQSAARLVAARKKTADAGGCKDVLAPSGLDQRLKEGFGAGREIWERRQCQRTNVECINREHIVVHRRIQLRRRARAVVLEVGAAKVV